ncbi:MAG: helix-turn-helix transcriptional regulator [Candidatus Hydrogenedentes bacterium]|nr:helix-turn-helix transcriptional regulator [Candidatus Hydrogenedentota bacterium]
MTSDAVDILRRRNRQDPKIEQLIQEEMLNLEVAQLIYDARQKARLTQAQLARRVGTTQSVIARLESADYRGHSLTMLRRIAAALGRGVEIRLTPPVRRAAPRA